LASPLPPPSSGYGRGQYRIGPDQGLRGIIARTNTNITDGSVKVMNVGTRGAMNMARILGTGLQKEMQDKSELKKVHRDVAAMMRDSVKSSFERTVRSRAGQYRMGQNRISGGRLKTAIMSRSLAIGTEEGIFFVDEQRLDKEAKHWRRLNFGAKGTAITGRTPSRFPLRFDDVTLYTVGFPDESRPSFTLPPGYFQSPEGGRVPFQRSRSGMDQFFPVTKKTHPSEGNKVSSTFQNSVVTKAFSGGRAGGRRGIPTRGIKPRNFMDAGLKRMVKELPPAYTRMVKGWLEDAEKSIQLPPIVNVRAGLGQNATTGRITQANP
jgi:hypothetical protein